MGVVPSSSAADDIKCVDLYPIQHGYVAGKTSQVNGYQRDVREEWSHEKDLVPVPLRRAGVTSILWKQTFEAAQTVWGETVKDMQTYPVSTVSRMLKDPDKPIWHKASCCILTAPCCIVCPCFFLDIHEAGVLKDNARAMNPRWVELIKDLQSQYTPLGIDLAPVKHLVADNGLTGRYVGIKFYLPSNDKQGKEEPVPEVAAVEAEVMLDRGLRHEVSFMDKLEKLIHYREEGHLTEEEFVAAKTKLLEP